jgi:hypothetical protein
LFFNTEALITQINMLTFLVATDASLYYPPAPENKSNPYSSSDSSSASDANLTQAYDSFFDLEHPLYGIDPSLVGIHKYDTATVYKDVFYKTNWKYAGGAVAATVLIILCIVPLYWKFWELGRKVTLGPFEIASAFQSPHFSSDRIITGHTEEVLKYTGTKRVRYGEVVDENGRRFVFQQV